MNWALNDVIIPFPLIIYQSDQIMRKVVFIKKTFNVTLRKLIIIRT